MLAVGNFQSSTLSCWESRCHKDNNGKYKQKVMIDMFPIVTNSVHEVVFGLDNSEAPIVTFVQLTFERMQAA